MTAATMQDMKITATDVSGQRAFSLKRLAPESSVSELVRKLVGKLDLASEDANGEPTVYRAFLEREGRHLLGSERAADTLQPDDKIVLTPDIQAG